MSRAGRGAPGWPFLWFRDDWFFLQFVMIAVGFLGKELVRWTRDGQRRHVFNPSAFSLGLFSVVLILTGSTGLTWGPEIASTLTLAPNIYAFLFLVGLVVMYFFHITLVAGFAGMGFTPTSQGGTHIVERNLTRLTVVVATLFFLNSVVLYRLLA